MKIFFPALVSAVIGLGIFRLNMSEDSSPKPNALYDGVNLLVLTDYEHAKELVYKWPVKTTGSIPEYLRLGTQYGMPIAFFNNSKDDRLGFIVGKRISPWSVGFVYTETPPKGEFLLVMWEPNCVK